MPSLLDQFSQNKIINCIVFFRIYTVVYYAKKVLNWIIEIYTVFVNMHGFYCFAAQSLHTVSNFPKWIIIDTNLSAVITHWEAVQIDSPITRIAKENGCTSIVQSGLALKMGVYISNSQQIHFHTAP